MTTNTTLENTLKSYPNVDTSKMYSMGNLRTPYLYFPYAIPTMWNYCLHVGNCIIDDKQYDLGFWMDTHGNISAAIVYGDRLGDYLSGDVTWQGRVHQTLYHRLIEHGFTDRQLRKGLQ